MGPGETNIVDENFWINLGAEHVYLSEQRMQESADRLQKAIVWVFGIYSSITFGSVLWSKKEDWDVFALILFGIAFVFLILSYWQITMATFHSAKLIHISAAADIKGEYGNSIIKFTKNFKYALILSTVGVVLYCVALIIQFASPSIDRLFNTSPKTKLNSGTIDSLNVITKLSVTEHKIYLNVLSKKRTWVDVNLKYDTIINKIKTTCQVKSFIGANDLRSNLPNTVYIDSTGDYQFNIFYQDHKSIYLEVSRIDSDIVGTTFKTITIKKRLK